MEIIGDKVWQDETRCDNFLERLGTKFKIVGGNIFYQTWGDNVW